MARNINPLIAPTSNDKNALSTAVKKLDVKRLKPLKRNANETMRIPLTANSVT